MDKEIDNISPAPWTRSGWTGELVSADGTSTEDFTREDVLRVVWFVTTVSDFYDEGHSTGCVQLKDGRFAAWEASVGVTGNGFSCDAYGGTADIVFAKTEVKALSMMTERARDLLAEQS